MSDRTDQFARELFRPNPGPARYLDLAIAGFFLLATTARGLIPVVLLAVMVLYARFAWNDLRTAVWLRRRDPHSGRGEACFWFSLSRSVLKGIVATECLVIIASGCLDRWHGPVDWRIPVVLLAGTAVPVSFAIVGWRSAARCRVSVWIDSGVSHSRKCENWPPRCRGSKNEVNGIGLLFVSLFLIFILALDSRYFLFSTAELLSAGVIVAVLLGGTLATRRVAAETPEDCWYSRKLAVAAAGAEPAS